MNIDDVTLDHIETADKTRLIPMMFEKQESLARRYGPVERRNGFYYPDLEVIPHIDDSQLQRWYKDMAWRTVEEIAEAYEEVAFISNDWKDKWDMVNVRHFFEEIADASHFFLEMSIVAGITSNDVSHAYDSSVTDAIWDDSHATSAFAFITCLGLAGNCLKNKPWKETQMPTDKAKFRRCLIQAWHQFFDFIGRLGLDLRTWAMLYMKKSEVNNFRLNTRY